MYITFHKQMISEIFADNNVNYILSNKVNIVEQ